MNGGRAIHEGYELDKSRALHDQRSAAGSSNIPLQPLNHSSSRQPTRTPTPLTPSYVSSSDQSPSFSKDASSNFKESNSYNRKGVDGEGDASNTDEDDDDTAWDVEDDDHWDPAMPSDLRSPVSSRSVDGRLHHQPLLSPKVEPYEGYDRRSSASRRRSAPYKEIDLEERAKSESKKKYTYAAFFLLISLISFTIQTETAVYIQHNLKWAKPYAMLYFTHGSWSILWFLQLGILRLQNYKTPWKLFWRRHVEIIRSTAQMTQYQDLHAASNYATKSPIPYMIKTVAFIACALTVAGGSWYVAVDLTTASDLTAIYNCSAFFAYAFSVPLLHEKLRADKVIAVGVAIIGVLVVAYGDSTPAKHGSKSGGGAGGPDSVPDPDDEFPHRLLGNIVIAVGSVLYGLYEVLYKRLACPPMGTSAGRSMIFANFVGTLIGSFTLFVLWFPLVILHYTGIEVFEWPTGEQSWMLAISVLCNAALLTIFLVALVDTLLPPPLHHPLNAAAILGGLFIVVAFIVLCWATYKEMDEERKENVERGDFIAVNGGDELNEDDAAFLASF